MYTLAHESVHGCMGGQHIVGNWDRMQCIDKTESKKFVVVTNPVGKSIIQAQQN